MSNELQHWLSEYSKRFKDSFPYGFIGMTEKEAIETIKQCLQTNKPYELELPLEAIL